ncbi:MAG TPA: hypothetical protein VFE04_12830 [Puia sp.]|nr:hypothetical protein [Puia sp.]
MLHKIWLIGLLSFFHSSCKKQSQNNISGYTVEHIDVRNIIDAECRFIRAHQLNDGAFTMSGERQEKGYKIVPYFNNLAAMALLENPNDSNMVSVKHWMIWYFEHLNADGSVFDYYSDKYNGNAVIISSNDFDSIDSYAATFISLCKKLCII